ERRRQIIVQADALKAERNAASEEVARRKQNREPADELLATLKASGERVKALDADLRGVEEEQDAILLRIPNLPHPDSPSGDVTANRVVRSWGEPATFGFAARPHWEVGESLDILDLPRGAK